MRSERDMVERRSECAVDNGVAACSLVEAPTGGTASPSHGDYWAVHTIPFSLGHGSYY
jgi:hypothetical protein